VNPLSQADFLHTLWLGIASSLQTAGVAIVVIGAVGTTAVFLRRSLKVGINGAFTQFRSDFGKAILLGLEFLVAADIVGTVAIGPTLQDLSVLGLLVLIRTFLSFSLEVEITGRWPWQSGRTAPRAD
jgi:uncharacterized membrane protein